MIARARSFARGVRAAAWLGYQIEANWTRPIVFLVFALAKPLATSLILLVMYRVVIGGTTSDPRFVGIYVGNALFVFVPLLLVGLSWCVFEDREQFQMLKYVYTTPIGLLAYLFGRATTKLVMSVLSCAVLFAFGALVLHLRFPVTPASGALFAFCLVVGIGGVIAVGLVMAGAALVFPRQAMTLNESTAAVLYLLCGAVFPPDILPHVMREIAFALPMTYWIEACRRLLVGPGFSAALAQIGTTQLVALQVAITCVWLAGGLALYRTMERSAQRAGKLDQTTDW